jgi:hypothetical protein
MCQKGEPMPGIDNQALYTFLDVWHEGHLWGPLSKYRKQEQRRMWQHSRVGKRRRNGKLRKRVGLDLA